MLSIYNSLTQKKEPFEPILPGTVKMYVCGMTVYDYCHLGHARVMVCFDMISRYLRARGYAVEYVRNITDIDDKIIHRANEKQIPFEALTEEFITAMHEDEAALGIVSPDQEPRATEHIPHIIHMITRLLEKGVAYEANDGDVYYAVSQFSRYGELAKKDLTGQEAGARVDVTDSKQSPLDFALWKAAKPNEPSWDSPWGKGRPGWHIECSAMSTECLGDTFDIHGGGADLRFPHHENEIAQSEAATGKTFVNTWMHVGFLQINKEKMSKSLGNFFTIRDVLKDYVPEAIRYFLLSSHYRSQLNYSTDNLQSATMALTRFYQCLRDLPDAAPEQPSEYATQFHAAMDDDFNTPQALAVLFEMTHMINQLRQSEPDKAARLAALLRELAFPLGLLQQAPEDFLKAGSDPALESKIQALIEKREQARADKAWSLADALRDELHALGVELEDSTEGTKWRLLR